MLIIAFICYLAAYAITLIILNKKRLIYSEYPKLYLKKVGIVFYSNNTHRLNIKNCKIMQVDKKVYINNQKKLIILSNVDNIYFKNNFMYYKALGKVVIFFNTTDLYKYFNIKIKSPVLDVYKIEQSALNELVNNTFQLKKCKCVFKYLNLIKNVLNINISKGKISVKQNKFKIPFVLTYKANNIIKQVNVSEIF